MEIDFKSEQKTKTMTNDQKLKQAQLKLKKHLAKAQNTDEAI